MIGEARRDATGSGWIMFIGPEPEGRPAMVDALRGLGFTLAIADDFHEAKRVLAAQPPDLLVTHVRLGEYNGLHLALKADAAGVPCIVMGPDDVVLRKDAESLHAIYLTTLSRDTLVNVLSRLLPAVRQAPKTVLPFRAHVTTVAAEADVMWRAFSESPSLELNAYGRPLLPN